MASVINLLESLDGQTTVSWIVQSVLEGIAVYWNTHVIPRPIANGLVQDPPEFPGLQLSER